MSDILGVRFREVGKIHYFVYPGDNIAVDDMVVAQTKRGVECGKVMVVNKKISFSRSSRDDGFRTFSLRLRSMKSYGTNRMYDASLSLCIY